MVPCLTLFRKKCLHLKIWTVQIYYLIQVTTQQFYMLQIQTHSLFPKEDYSLMEETAIKVNFQTAMLKAIIRVSMRHHGCTRKKNVKFGSNLKSLSGQADTWIPSKLVFQLILPAAEPLPKVNLLWVLHT